jgi:hypothetical protein
VILHIEFRAPATCVVGVSCFIASLFWTKLRLGECRGKVFFYYAEPKQVRRRQQQPMCYVSSVAVFMIALHYILSCFGFFRCGGCDTRLSTRTGGVKLDETEENLLEHRTDGTDAFDTLFIGCEKFPQRNFYPISTNGVL